MIDRASITGLVLAGGQGSRMGGVDKGLQPFHGVPLALHAARRLEPQVGSTAISANRHVERYESFGFTVWQDADPQAFDGPLAGFLAGLERCATPWLVTVPCDSPLFPQDIVARLVDAVDASGARLAVVESGDYFARPQPGFCLLEKSLAASLRSFLQSGERKVSTWVRAQRCAVAHVADEPAFANANTSEELGRLERLELQGRTSSP